jgi:hypothetical protein
MGSKSRIYLPSAVVLLTLTAAALCAGVHHSFNGTWRLIPARGELAGEPIIQTGTVTIADRQGNIYVSRDFTFDGESQTANYSYSTDGRANSWIHEGKLFKSKAKWEGNELRILAEQDNIISTERFSLTGDGTLKLVVERPGHHTVTLYFERSS